MDGDQGRSRAERSVRRSRRRRDLRALIGYGFLGLLYLLSADLSHLLSLDPDPLSILWPASGVFLAALLMAPSRHWWMVVAMLAGIHLVWELMVHARGVLSSIGFCLGSCVEAVVGAAAIIAWSGRPFGLRRLRDVLALAGTVMILSAPLGAVLGAGAVWLSGQGAFWRAFRIWWISDGLGMLLVTPLLLKLGELLNNPKAMVGIGRRRLLEGFAMLAAQAAAVQLVFGSPAPSPVPSVTLAPLLLWSAGRFGQGGVSASMWLISVIVIANTFSNLGPYSGQESVIEAGIQAQIFLAVCSLIGHVLAAFFEERQQAEAALRQANVSLDQRVNQRTAELAEASEVMRVSEERFRLAAQAVAGIIYDWELETGHVQRTMGLFEVLGYWPAEVPPTIEWWIEQIHPEDRSILADPTTNGADLHDLVLEYRVRHRQGHYLDVMDRRVVLRLPSGAPTRIVGCIQDVTPLKTALQRLKDEARRKDRFLAVLAHELRNSLAPIHNAVAVMASGGQNHRVDPWARDVIARQSRHLSRLVDDLLDVSRIGQGKLILARKVVEVSTIVRNALEASLPDIEQRRHRLEVAIPEGQFLVDGDLTRLTQVVLNLLQNAAKYTPDGGLLRLAVEGHGEQVWIRVQDSGIGIPPDMLPKVFRLFTQVDHALDRSEQGLGIGLTLVKRLVELHGGTVSAHSEGVGRGSEFIVKLPLAPPSAEIQSPSEIPPNLAAEPAQGRRILIVDDNRDLADTLAHLLRSLHHEVATAHSGDSALAEALAFLPDLILLDLGLPGVDGYEVAERIRREPKLSDVCIVALTAYGDAGEPSAKTSSFDAHVTKPVELKTLRELIDSLPATVVPDRRG